MGRAEDLFSRISRGGASAVDDLIANAQSENLWLDFKRAGNDGRGTKLHESDWKNFAKSLSGFANSDGGVILWGVDCSSDPILGDVPTGATPLENPGRFVSWLEGAVSACTVPAVPGVESLAIMSGTNTGYVAVLVPASPVAPHQCVKPAGSVQYYIRAGSSFMPTPHAVLAGMFGRRPQPKVFQTLHGTALIDQRGSQMVLKLDVFVHAYNEGPAIARDAYMNILLGVPGGGSKGSVVPDPDETGNWITQMSFGVLASAIATDSYRLAPQVHARVFRVRLELAEPFTSTFGIRITVGCDGAPMHVSNVDYDATEIQRRYQAALALLLEKNRGSNEAALAMFFGEPRGA